MHMRARWIEVNDIRSETWREVSGVKDEVTHEQDANTDITWTQIHTVTHDTAAALIRLVPTAAVRQVPG